MRYYKVEASVMLFPQDNYSLHTSMTCCDLTSACELVMILIIECYLSTEEAHSMCIKLCKGGRGFVLSFFANENSVTLLEDTSSSSSWLWNSQLIN